MYMLVVTRNKRKRPSFVGMKCSTHKNTRAEARIRALLPGTSSLKHAILVLVVSCLPPNEKMCLLLLRRHPK